MNRPDQELLAPARDRVDIEWSVALSRDRIASDRFVVYGLQPEEMLRYLSLRGVDGEGLFRDLGDDLGPPCQVAVGHDGDRTKAYWFLESADPAFFGVDFVGTERTSRKRYRLVEVDEVESKLDPRLHETVTWLLARPEFQGDALFHMVALRRDGQEHDTGVHLGLRPDWRGLIQGDASLLQPDLVRDLLMRLELGHHQARVERVLLSPPMAWTCYVSVLLRSDGSLGANIYGRANPVAWREGGCWLTEPGRGGVVPRPVVITFTLEGEPGVAIRMRWYGTEPCFIESEGWRVEYRSEEGDDTLRARGVFDRMRRVIRSVTHGAGPDRPVVCLERLEALEEAVGASMGPDMRYAP